MRTASGVISTSSSWSINSRRRLDGVQPRRREDDVLVLVLLADVGELLLADGVHVEIVRRGCARRRSCPRRPRRPARRTSGRAAGGANSAYGVAVPGAVATSAPFLRRSIGPAVGQPALEQRVERPVPRVSVRNCERKPMSPRDGTTNSMRARPKPRLCILSMRPRRSPRRCGDGADVLVRHVDDHALRRARIISPSISLHDDLGAAERELVALAAHRLGKDRDHQLAAAVHRRRRPACRSPRSASPGSCAPRARGGRAGGARSRTCRSCRRTARCSRGSAP